MGAKFNDLTGEKFSRLTVISRMGSNNNKRALWECKCECGVVKVLPTNALKGGDTKSCGCLNREVVIERMTKHGGKGTAEYGSWLSMFNRCTNKNTPAYEFYGERGITICDRWSKFENFIADMGKKPFEDYSIERIDVDGNYEPSNCRWDSKTEQSRNQRLRKDNVSGSKGVYWYKGRNRWISTISVNKKRKILGYFINLQDAVNARIEGEKLYWLKESS